MGPDTIKVTEAGGRLTVASAKVRVGAQLLASIPVGSANRIYVASLAGADVINVSTVTKKATIIAGAGNDSIAGGLGNDDLYGRLGNDTISGGAGVDMLFGEDGNDAVRGDDGNDSLFAGAGNDSADGGAGDDV